MYSDLPLIDDVLHLSTVEVDPMTYMPGPAILDAEQLLIKVFAVFLVRIPYEDVLELCCMTFTFFIVMLLWLLLIIPIPAPVNPQSIVCPLPSKTTSSASTENAVVFANMFPFNTYVVPDEFKL
jgi:hypothetical protein